MASRVERFAALPGRAEEDNQLLAYLKSRERVSRLGVIGLDPQRLLVVLDCLLPPARVLQGDSQIVVGIGAIGVDAKRLFQMVDRFRCPAHLRQDNPQIILSIGEIGLDP